MLLAGLFLIASLTLTGTAPTPGFDFHQPADTATDTSYPVTWSDEAQVLWRADLAGFGQSVPVVFGDRVVVTSVANNLDQELIVTCLSLKTGAVLWRKAFSAGQKVYYSTMVARAAPTPVVDASGIILFYGSGDLLKLDHDGQILWTRSLTAEFGPFQGNHGVGTSPVLYRGILTLLIDHEGPSYLLAINPTNGQTIWRRERPARVSWTTPLPIRYEGRDQLIISSNGIIESIALKDGEQLWFSEDVNKNSIPSPARFENLIIIGASTKASSQALSLGGQGNLAGTCRAWRGAAAASGATPLVVGREVYFINRAGVVSCVDARSGSVHWQHRIGASCWATPRWVDGRLYFFTSKGETVVMKADPSQATVIASNSLAVSGDDAVYAVTPAAGRFLYRTGSRITALGHVGAPQSTKTTP